MAAQRVEFRVSEGETYKLFYYETIMIHCAYDDDAEQAEIQHDIMTQSHKIKVDVRRQIKLSYSDTGFRVCQ